MMFIITYGKGRPGGTTEARQHFENYREAFAYAADNAHGWGFAINPAEIVEETAATEQPAKVAEVDTDGGEGDEPKTAQEWDEESQRVEEATREALRRAGLLVEETEGGNPMHNENLNPGDIYAAALEALPPQDIDHSGSDLYLRKTPAAKALIQRLSNRAMLSCFTDSDGCAWYDLPFCFTPYWENPRKHI